MLSEYFTLSSREELYLIYSKVTAYIQAFTIVY